ncbi:hypothetical protein HCZ97_11955 [Pseudooceanicola sp. HF7]|nr:hypothetical protein [Pseudooceanicola sp. HF7]
MQQKQAGYTMAVYHPFLSDWRSYEFWEQSRSLGRRKSPCQVIADIEGLPAAANAGRRSFGLLFKAQGIGRRPLGFPSPSSQGSRRKSGTC